MIENEKSLLINQLKVGMLSASDIKFDGRLLLAKGAIITESTLRTLKDNYIVDNVKVYTTDISEKLNVIKTTTVEEVELAFNEFSLSLEKVFDNLSNSIEELRTFSNKVQDEFLKTGVVIRDTVFFNNKSNTIYRHSVNVSAISFILGKWIGLNENEINLLTYSALLHDFGKTKISKHILNKTTNLTLKEKKILRTHTILGYNFVKNIPFLNSSVGYGILMHHERIDGSGYPFGLKGAKVHKFAKVIAIADLFDNISSNNEQGPFEALKVLQDESLLTLDFNYCNMFLHHVVNYCMGETVVLNDNRHCKVIKVDLNDLTHPLLLSDGGFIDLKAEKDLHIKKMFVS